MHCEPIEKVADDFITMCNIQEGNFDNVSACKYEVPDYWTIGEVYHSWIDDVISNYNSDFSTNPENISANATKRGKSFRYFEKADFTLDNRRKPAV